MIDLLLLGLIVVSALFGLMRGLLATVFGVLGWLLAGWAAFRFGHDASVLLSGGATPTAGQYAAGYAIAFFGVLLAVSAIGLLLRGVVDSTVLLKAPDRLFGFGLGLVRGVLLAVLAVLVLGFTPVADGEPWRRSQLASWLHPPADWLRARLPELPELPELPAVPEHTLLDLGKAVLAGDNAGLSEHEAGSGLPQAMPERADDARPAATGGSRQDPAKAWPSNIDPAQVRPDHPGPARAGPSGQARPPSR
ncbi:CvpA family protein [Stenotrophomonas acidaminiphila]|uniref:CvpA family protein n=1 Tax=Stenotrophomonas acidaminiphila TaxID=128780 RepID=UPI0028B0C276|nr:CvpA family protein [Stenotrophomonas acidaminiphila]